MAEYPPRTCGACQLRGKYEKVAESHGDYLQYNTVPKPELIPKGNVTLKDPQLGVPGTYYPPDIQQPAINMNNSKQPQSFQSAVQKTNSLCCCKGKDNKTMREQCQDSTYKRPDFRDPNLEIQNTRMEYNLNTEANVSKMGPPTYIPDINKLPPAPQPLKGILKTKTPCRCEQKVEDTTEAKLKKKVQPQQKPEEKDEKNTNTVCYLPKPDDTFPDQREDAMGALGPWATGRLDWGPLAGLTGVRPVVDKYSISRFSEGEWRQHNKEVLDKVIVEQHKANLLEYNSKEGIEETRKTTDKNQEDSTKRLQQREQQLHRWKCELERAISASDEEICMMQEQRRRLKMSMAVLQLPESISGECIERRTGRLDPELVRDEVEEELIKEMALTAEIREQFTRTLADIEHQLLEDKTAKSRLEYDWSDKKQANEIECINVALNNRSNILMFKPGAVGFPDHQSSQEHYEKFTRDTLEESEITRQRSVALRGTLDAILQNAARDLRSQADKVEMALAKRIACTDEVRNKLENELLSLLKRLADIETTVVNLRNMIRRMDSTLKMCQTRLDNRILYRPRIENCRDDAQYGLVEEAKTIGDNVAALMSQLKQAEDTQSSLMMVRGDLEKEIMLKRKTLQIDRDRIQLIRSHYPSATALSGY